MTTMMLIGAMLGGVVWLLVVVVSPPRTSPVAALAQIDRIYGSEGPVAGDEGPDRPARVGRWLTGQAGRRGIVFSTLRANVALAGTTLEAIVAVKAACALAGFLLTLLAAGVLSLAGVAAPVPMVVVVALAIGAGAFFLPDVVIASQAAARRAEFTHALAAYVEWVQLEMAGSAAPAEALAAAARAGAGWPFALIRASLFRAARSGQGQWAALADLGEQIGVKDLADLGKLVRSVAADGAQVRSTLSARAEGMRHAQLAEATGEAGKKDQSMQIAQIVVGLGFLLFISFPAVVRILSM